ncbi:VOC family protein [uncultured Croceitalea sp.]|uniref:VOC family protein n=1 Tax=uncultured Croceitalea sp. TaxID=1798908 RepID=UPI00330589AB
MKIEHLAIWVNDIEVMKNFYIKYFMATPSEKYHNAIKSFTSYFLSFDEECRLELMHRPDVQHTKLGGQELMGLAHFAISVGTQQKVNTLTETLRNDGFVVVGEPRTTGDGYYESVVLDPEQNRIEITI